MQMVHQHPAAMLRCLAILGGIVAVLGRSICTATKATANTPEMVNNAMMRPPLHYTYTDKVRCCFHQNQIKSNHKEVGM
jgi:hypothetical protein